MFCRKKKPFAVEAAGVLSDLRTALRTEDITGVRVLNRYDIENIDESDYHMAQKTILSEPQVDDIYEETAPAPGSDEWVLAVEYLPGQFDQRADSCAQCIQLSTCKERPEVKTARVYYIRGKLSDEEKLKIKEALINPVEAREADMEKPATIKQNYASRIRLQCWMVLMIWIERAWMNLSSNMAWQWIWTTSLSASSILKMRRNVALPSPKSG